MTTLARDHPAVLLTLNSSNRMLGLTTNQLDPWSYYGIGSLRLLVADPLFFLLGRWYGDAAIRWVERKWASQGEVLRMFERGSRRRPTRLSSWPPTTWSGLPGRRRVDADRRLPRRRTSPAP